jgi:hypothetical protein
MEESKRTYKVQTFGREPILPVFSEVLNRQPYVLYGDNNMMPNYLISRYQNCAIHKSIVTSKQSQIVGDGLYSNNAPISVVTLVNTKETITDVYRKCALDLVLFGGYALNIIWSNDRKSIAEIWHTDFSRVRCGKVNPETDEIDTYYYSPDWSNVRKYPPEEIPAFNQNTKEPSQLIYYKDYSPNMTYYPEPDYFGAMMAIEIDINIKTFHNNNLKNGMTPSLWINFNNGIPPEDEQRILTRALEEQYGSANNGGRPIISFNESKELAPEVTQITTSANDNYYTTLYQDIQTSILAGHRITSGELFGISTPGALGVSRQQLQDSSEYFYKTVIMGYINQLLPTFDKIMSLKQGQLVNLKVKPLTIFDDTTQINQSTPTTNG